MPLCRHVACLVLLLLPRHAAGSLGDVQPAYRGCLHACVASGCVGGQCVPSCASQRPDDLGAALQLLRWDCEARPLRRRAAAGPAR